MNEQLQALRDDISYVKAIAEDSGQPYRRDGLILAVTGVVLGLSVLWSWMTQQGVISWPAEKWRPMLQAYVPYELWLIAVAVIWWKFRRRPESVATRAISATWSSFLLYFIASWGFMLATIRLGHAPKLVEIVIPILFALYGMAWWVAAAVRQSRTYRLIALGCYTAEFITGFLIGTSYVQLAFAVALFTLVAAPGFVILRQTNAR